MNFWNSIFKIVFYIGKKLQDFKPNLGELFRGLFLGGARGGKITPPHLPPSA